MGTTINMKIKHIFTLMEKLAEGAELYAGDTVLQELLFEESGNERNERALRRYLEDIHTLYGEMIVTEKKPKEYQERKVTVYRVAGKRDVSDVLKFFLEKGNDLTWVIQMLQEEDPSILRGMESDAVRSIENELEEDRDIFLFRSRPFEVFESDRQRKIFSHLKTAVKNHEYRTIYRKGAGLAPVKNAKCLKLIYSENNWYVAVETEDGKLRLIRIAFVEKVEYAEKATYQKSVLSKYAEYFLDFQNPMTLAGKKKQTARFRAHGDIAKYFREEMKPYFRSQKYIGTNKDGSIDFSVDYTQPLEILPFAKRWLPQLEICAPESLRAAVKKELEESLKRLESEK